ncbi:hypothetical protein CLU79DRAFT_717365 [Phycomyces nitens]|nr:hypothetical protein CLU79DRAFT_717365 [Phycomyces nitens]
MYYREQMNHDPLETVYAFWVGVADIQKILQDHDPKDQNPPDFTKVIDCISQQMRNTRKVFGANRMIVLSVPPLELLPYFQDQDLKKKWGDASREFNRLLEKDSILLNQHHSALELDIIHVHTLLRDIVQNPASFGFNNAKDSYWDTCQGQCKDKIDSYVWWDKTELTGGAHRAIANSILLSGSLEPSTFLEESVDVNTLLTKKGSIYRSPIYEPKTNTGLIEKVMKDIMKDKEDSEASEPLVEDEDNEEDEYDGGYSINHIYLFVIIIAFVCIGFVYFAKAKRSGNLSALSGLIGNRNQGRGRFIPLRNIETQA